MPHPTHTWRLQGFLSHRGGADLLCDIKHLRQSFCRLSRTQNVVSRAMVVLPASVHAVWTLPSDSCPDACWTTFIATFQKDTTQSFTWLCPLIAPIDDAQALEWHIRDTLALPVAWGLCDDPADWPYGSASPRNKTRPAA